MTQLSEININNTTPKILFQNMSEIGKEVIVAKISRFPDTESFPCGW